MKKSELSRFYLKKFSQNSIKSIIQAKIGKNESLKNDSSENFNVNLLRIFKTLFYAIALDFDGTLIPLKERTASVSPELIGYLRSLNSKKIPIFILTGRGRSIFKQFPLEKFIHKSYIMFALYNGGKIYRGNNKIFDLVDMKTIRGYSEIRNFFEKNNIKYTEKECMFGIKTVDNFQHCSKYISNLPLWKIEHTRYSFDISPNVFSKKTALEKCGKLFGIDITNILKIGDSGSVGGNDYNFLQVGNSLSVGDFDKNNCSVFPIFNSDGKQQFGPNGIKYIFRHLKII